MFGNTSISLEDICNSQDEIDSKFDEISTGYRAVISLFNSNKVFVSKELFSTYELAWNYAKDNSKYFNSCEFYVIDSQSLPEIHLENGVFNASK